MALLRSFFLRRVRVHVLIRRSAGVRGVLSAYLSAFDKHWNLLLLDVAEQYSTWEWRHCGKDTLEQLRRNKLNFQVPKQKRAVAHTEQRQGETAAGEPASTAATPSSLADDAAADTKVSATATTAAESSPPLYVRVEVWKQRQLQQLYVRGDGIVSVSEFAPQGLQQLHTVLQQAD
jgi:small nuclear ribonucleoprotein (snRNP)-like protein